MKIVKWGSVIALTFSATWILIFTFMQEPFRVLAGAKIFWYETPGVPLYAFAAGAFAVGLIIGLGVAAYYYFSGRTVIHGKQKEIGHLDELVKEMGGEIERMRASAAAAQERERERTTKSQKAVGGQTRDKTTKSQKAVGEKDLLT